MKTIITIENNPIGGSKVTIQVDDEQPVRVETSPPADIKQGSDIQPERTIPGSDTDVTTKTIQKVAKSPVLDKLNPVNKSLDLNKVAADVAKHQAKKLGENIVENPTVSKRECEVCHDDISNLNKLRKLCKKPECLKESNRRYAREYWQKKHGKDAPDNRITKPATRQETASLAVTPEFLPGYEKSPEEIEALRPKPMNLPGAAVPSGGGSSKAGSIRRFCRSLGLSGLSQRWRSMSPAREYGRRGQNATTTEKGYSGRRDIVLV